MQEVYTLKKGDYVAPGFFMRYWGAIVDKYGEQRAFSLNSLKLYKEMRVGAILAALWTSATNDKWFVGMPEEEPSDIELLRMIPTVTSSGRESFNHERVRIQVTRCSAPDGEDIVRQIERKNKPVLSKHTLIVDVTGEGQKIDINDVAQRLKALGTLHPREIAIVATVGSAASVPYASTYLQFLLHPNYRSSEVESADSSSFFTEPAIVNLKRRISRNISPSRKVNLQLP